MPRVNSPVVNYWRERGLIDMAIHGFMARHSQQGRDSWPSNSDEKNGAETMVGLG